MMSKRDFARTLVLAAGAIVVFSAAVPLLSAWADGGAGIVLNVASAEPRAVEETTKAAIEREYATAWKTLATALRENRADQLPASFVGTAKEDLVQRVQQQKQNNLSTRITERSHKLEVVFYSPEGSAMQLRDRVTLDQQYLEGGKVVHSEEGTREYLVLMTVAEDRWKVRLLQDVGRQKP